MNSKEIRLTKTVQKGTLLLIHGGAGSKSARGKNKEHIETSLTWILNQVYPLLQKGSSALKAVTLAVELLENDPLYNAGLGSKLQQDGRIRMSASLMAGHQQKFAGCVNVQGVKNPIRLAEKLLHHDSRVLAEAGAVRFAKEHKLLFSSPYTKERRQEYEKKKKGLTGTVGAVALDKNGHLAAATSTGGRGFEYPHRVSDSPTVAGNFANHDCAVSATGIGEQIVDFAVAASLATLIEAGVPLSKASRGLIKKLAKARAQLGFIAITRSGRFVGLTTTKNLTWASATPEGYEIHS